MSDEQLETNWQRHRLRCIKLAIKAGVPIAALTAVAETIGLYILTRSETEIQQRAALTPEKDK